MPSGVRKLGSPGGWLELPGDPYVIVFDSKGMGELISLVEEELAALED